MEARVTVVTAEGYRLMYTSAASFTVNRRCRVGFGPLAHILGDGDGIMEHMMLKGTYHIHRVGKTTARRPAVEEVFTVIAVSRVDPLKLVAECVKWLSPEQSVKPHSVSIFDDRRWTELIGEARRAHPRGMDQLALTSYASHLFGLKDEDKHHTRCMSREEMADSDNNTFCIRVAAKPRRESMRFALASPGLSEFIATDNDSDTLSLIGVSHCASPSNMRGYVLYTDTDVLGQKLRSRDRAFALVLGPKHDGNVEDRCTGSILNITDFLVDAGLERTGRDLVSVRQERKPQHRLAAVPGIPTSVRLQPDGETLYVNFVAKKRRREPTTDRLSGKKIRIADVTEADSTVPTSRDALYRFPPSPSRRTEVEENTQIEPMLQSDEEATLLDLIRNIGTFGNDNGYDTPPPTEEELIESLLDYWPEDVSGRQDVLLPQAESTAHRDSVDRLMKWLMSCD